MRSDVVIGDVAGVRGRVREWAESWENAPVHVVYVDGAKIGDSASLFRELAAALDFPDYFGHNWDALDECLRDYLSLAAGGLGSMFGGRPGVDANGLLLVLLDTDSILRSEPDLVVKLAGSLRIASTENPYGRSAGLWVVFHVREEGSEGAVREILESIA